MPSSVRDFTYEVWTQSQKRAPAAKMKSRWSAMEMFINSAAAAEPSPGFILSGMLPALRAVKEGLVRVQSLRSPGSKAAGVVGNLSMGVAFPSIGRPAGRCARYVSEPERL